MYYALIFRKQAPPLPWERGRVWGLVRKASPPPFGHPLSEAERGKATATALGKQGFPRPLR